MAKNSFRVSKHVDHTILDEHGNVVCTLRIKPGGICWAPADATKWRRISLKRFAEFMESYGKLIKK